jgi:predicted anti-sigma-YlaC factor YlaD
MPRSFRHAPIPPISCREVVELVTTYLEGALDSTTTRRVNAHLGICEPCRIYIDQIRATIAGLGGAVLPELPEDVCMGLVEAFRGSVTGATDS